MLAVGGGLVVGVFCAVHPKGLFSQAMMAGSLLGASLPTFLIGILLILVFSVGLGWLPSYGRGEVVNLGGWRTGLLTLDGWRHVRVGCVYIARAARRHRRLIIRVC